MGVEASVVVAFGESVGDTGGNVVIELDDLNNNNLDSDGDVKSTFLPGEQPVFLINHSSDLVIDNVLCTDGSISQTGSNQQRTRDKEVLFIKLDETVSLSYSGVDAVSIDWWGNEGEISVSESVLTIDGGAIPCAGLSEFNVLFQNQYTLTPPALSLLSDETYKITIVVYMEAA